MSMIIGLDYGSSKVGLATADSVLLIALPYGVCSPTELPAKLAQASLGQEIEYLVVGLPLSLTGEDSAQTTEVREFVEKLKQDSGYKVVLIDERFTTSLAVKQGKDDAVAAMHLLQNYLDSHGPNANQ